VREAPGNKRPIVQAPPAAVPRLTAAVSNAGAPAMVTLAWPDDAGAVVPQTAAPAARPAPAASSFTEDHHRLADQLFDLRGF
jgi:hypothetical protein